MRDTDDVRGGRNLSSRSGRGRGRDGDGGSCSFPRLRVCGWTVAVLRVGCRLRGCGYFPQSFPQTAGRLFSLPLSNFSFHSSIHRPLEMLLGGTSDSGNTTKSPRAGTRASRPKQATREAETFRFGAVGTDHRKGQIVADHCLVASYCNCCYTSHIQHI